MKILNRKEVKEIENMTEEVYGAKDTLKGFTVLITGRREKIWISNRDIFEIDLEKLRVNAIGLYFGRIDGGRLKLSVEATAIVGPKADKKVVELTDDQLWDFVRGFDVDLSEKIEDSWNYYIVKHKKNWLGIAKIEENVLKNALPKSRKIHSLTKQ